ncbi:tyrosine-type recombinase/integrase [Bacillus piscicola]|uniref:tyrosine-type recombinase/integrase n=1 Tax=Bacillus piscicola TaxID=1632684 RepID=UPI003B8317E9
MESYVHDVKRLFLKEQIQPPHDLSRSLVKRYLETMRNDGFAIATINKAINTFQVLYLYFKHMGESIEPFVYPKRDRKHVMNSYVDVLKDEEVDKLMMHMHNQAKKRDRLIIYILLYTGVRVSELINIRTRDIDRLTGTLQVTGKGGKIRELPLRADVLEQIESYVRGERRESRFAESSYLLLSQRAAKLHRDTVNRLCNRLSRELTFQVYPHKCRRTYASRLLAKKADLSMVPALLEHHSVALTARYYLHHSNEDRQAAVEKL